MERWSGKTAIVTEASSGIGEAIVEGLVKAGMNVVGLTLRVERVEATVAKLAGCPGKLHALKCDMRSEEDICNAFDWTTKNVGVVHVLVNNAGVLLPTSLVDGDAETWRTIMDTNVIALSVAQQEACKLMMAHRIAGHIVNINSTFGQPHMYFPTTSKYGPSKHAVTSICKNLRGELAANKSQIKVTSVSPGAVKTERTYLDAFPVELEEAYKNKPAMDSKDVANAVMYALGTPPAVNVNEITLRPLKLE